MAVLAYTLDACWGPRKESMTASAQLLQRFFKDLCKCDPLLSKWFEGASSKKKALERNVDVHDMATLERLLLKGRNRTDIGKHVIDDLGFSVHLWNGGRTYGEEASVSVHCGCYNDVLMTANDVTISFSRDLGTLANWSKMIQVVRTTALAWKPDFASVSSLAALAARGYTHPCVDWMLYLPARKYDLPNAIPAAHVERLDDLGTIIVVQEEPPDPANPEHTRNIERVREALGL